MKGDNCLDFSSQRFFCQFFSYLRTHDLALLQSFHRKFSDWRPLSRCSYYVPFGSRVKSGRSGVSVAFKRKQFESPGCRCRACEGRRESCTFGANANRGARLYVEAQDIWEQMSSGKISPGIPKGRGSHRVENWRSIDEQISGICSSRGNQPCHHDLGLLDSTEFIWLGIGISAGRFNEPGLCGWIPTRRRPFMQLLEAGVSLSVQAGSGRTLQRSGSLSVKQVSPTTPAGSRRPAT